MDENVDLTDMERDAYQESVRDGLMFVFLGILLFITSGIVLQPSLAVFTALWVIFIPPVYERVRAKYTYPRIGYVKLREEDPKKLGKGILGFVALIFIIVIVILFVLFGSSLSVDIFYRSLPFIFGLILLGPSVWLVDKSGKRVYYLFGTLTSVSGLVFAITEFDFPMMGFSLYLLSWSIVLLFVGLTMFIRFIRKYPIQDVPEAGESEQ